MPAPNLSGITDNFFTFAQRGWLDSLNGSISDSATTITFNSLTGYTDGQSVLLWLEPKTDNEELVYGIVSGSAIVSVVRGVLGTATAHSSGAAATEYISSAHHDLMRKGILVHSNQDGTLKDGAVHSPDVLASNSVTTNKVLNDAITPVKRSGGFKIGTFQTSGTGSASVTGVGFRPKLVMFTYSVGSDTIGSYSQTVYDGTTTRTVGFQSSTAAHNSWSTTDFRIEDRTNTNLMVATMTSLDADGFTYNVTTAGTHTFIYTAYG